MGAICSSGIKGKSGSIKDKKTTVDVVLIGLDDAGKTTICNTMGGQPDRQVVPTVGFSKARTIAMEGDFNATLLDLGGAVTFRETWVDRMTCSHAAIFVVDSSNSERMIEARDELATYSNEDKFKGKPILVFANKQDLPNSCDEVQIAEHLGLNKGALSFCSHKIVKCIAKKAANNDTVDPALNEGLQWLIDSAAKQWEELYPRVAADKKVLEAEEEKRRAEVLKRAQEIRKQREEAEARGETIKKVAAAPAENVVVQCKNMLIQDDKRVQCTKNAEKRNTVTAWQPFCMSCYEVAFQKAEEKKAKLAAEEAAANGEAADTGSSAALTENFDSEPRQGTRIECRFMKKEKWLYAMVSKVNVDGTLDVVYDDGDKEEAVERDYVLVVGAPLEPGTKVEAIFRGKGDTYYPGTIESFNAGDGSYSILFDDGDSDKAARRAWIKVAVASTDAAAAAAAPVDETVDAIETTMVQPVTPSHGDAHGLPSPLHTEKPTAEQTAEQPLTQEESPLPNAVTSS